MTRRSSSPSATSLPIDVNKKSPYSIDQNVWGRACETGFLEDIWNGPIEDVYGYTPTRRSTAQPDEVVIAFEHGVPTAIDGEPVTMLQAIEQLNARAGAQGIGRIDMVEDRLVGIKSREVYEAPGAMALITAHMELENVTMERDLARFKRTVDQRWAELVYDGLWFSPLKRSLDAFVAESQKHVTGEIRMTLHGGRAVVTGRRSTESLYDFDLATYDTGDTFDQSLAKGFVQMWGMPSRIAAGVTSTRRRSMTDPGQADGGESGPLRLWGGRFTAVVGPPAPQRPAAGAPMTALPFAWRSLVRQPARAALGILGVAAVGALLLDMLLLSDGLVTSMRDMLERTGFDIRVTATGELPQRRQPDRPRVEGDGRLLDPARGGARDGDPVRRRRRGADGTRERDGVRDGRAEADAGARANDGNDPTQGALRANEAFVSMQAIGGEGQQPWTVLSGRDATGALEVVVSQATAEQLRLPIGTAVPLRARCQSGSGALPATTVRVVGLVEFPLALGEHVIGSSMATLDAACGGNTADEAEAILVRATGDVEQTAAALRRRAARPAAADERPGAGPAAAHRLHLLPADLRRADDGHAVVRAAAHHGAADRVGEPAARRDCGAARARLLARRAWWPTCCASRRSSSGSAACCRCRSALAAGAGGSTASSRPCPAFPARCTSSCSSRGRSALHAGLLAADGGRRRALSDAHRGAAADRRDAAQRGDVVSARCRHHRRAAA